MPMSMDRYVTVYHRGRRVLCERTVMDLLGLRPGQDIDRGTLINIIEFNATVLLADCHLLNLTRAHKIDTAALEESVAQMRAVRG